MKKWTEDKLKKLPVENGFRLRGFRMTRLETLTDAAFAFSITMLVISVGKIPGNLVELIAALKTTPALMLSFSMIFLFWSNHRTWSRNYGLENFLSQLITFGLIFIFLVYIYPLRLMASLLMFLVSNGYLPSEFIVYHFDEVPTLFVIYGTGFTLIAFLFSLLFYQGLSNSHNLSLNQKEKTETVMAITAWAICCATGFIATIIAATTPTYIGVFSGFIYSTLPVSVFISSKIINRKV